MLLKVGELAKRTGLTVRTLHHYDEIGLLMPSGRSDSGYRLYSRDDVARLHGIQALRHLGLPLKDIAGLLDGAGAGPHAIVDQQIRALDQEIAQASELRGRLALMREGLVLGTQPDMVDWLGTLALMATYGKYFSAAELKYIFENWKPLEAEWGALKAEVRAAMDRGLAPGDMEVQPLANRWMALMLHWMKGDFELMERWGVMYRLEPSAQGYNHAPEGDMIEFITRSIDGRKELLLKHVSLEEMRRLGRVPLADWRALEARVLALMREQAAPGSAAAQDAVRQWNALLDRLTSHDAGFRAKLAAAWAAEPLLAAGSSLSAPVRAWLREAAAKTA